MGKTRRRVCGNGYNDRVSSAVDYNVYFVAALSQCEEDQHDLIERKKSHSIHGVWLGLTNQKLYARSQLNKLAETVI